MNSLIKLHVVRGLTLVGAMFGFARSAQADINVAAPAGTGTVSLGQTPQGTALCFTAGGATQSTLLVLAGTTNGLNDNLIVSTGNALGGVIVAFKGSPGFSATCWASALTPVVGNGHTIVVAGGSGPDSFRGPAATTSSIWFSGLGGNDSIVRYTSGFTVGGVGNDRIRGYTGSNEVLSGEGGSDCIDDAGEGATTYDCGADTDSYDDSDATYSRVSCETQVSTCGI